MQSTEVTIEVASRAEAGHILCSHKRCAEITCLVSIGEPHDKPPAGYRNVRRKLRLLFADVETEESGPTEDDVRKIIQMAETLKAANGKVLIHCEAGISRSAAAALIMYSSWLGPGREREAMARVLNQRPFARPNRRMVALADKLLERNGSLVAALTQSEASFGQET
ncbi:MAG: dual specificity protein phosphatase family protein [Blastocatellales bacterium]